MSAANERSDLDKAIAKLFAANEPPEAITVGQAAANAMFETHEAAIVAADEQRIKAENDNGTPLVRKGQRWLFKGQYWKIHELLNDGIVVLIGPHNRHELLGTSMDELFECGELFKDAPSIDARTEKLAKAFEQAREKLKKPFAHKRGPKPRLPPVARPWRACILAIDTAANSGWSCWVDGDLRDFGEVKTSKDAKLLTICKLAQEHPPSILVLEAPAGMVYGGRGASTLVGLGAAREAWRRAWRDAGGLKTRIISVKPTRWRSEAFGKVRGVKDIEQQRARLILKQHAVTKLPEQLGEDEAAALCIGGWAIYSGEVGMVLPATLRLVVGL